MVDENVTIVNCFFECLFSLSVGNHSPNAGFGNTANANTEAFIAEIAAQRGLTEAAQRQTAKAQEQIDRLLGIIEGMQK